MIILERGEKKDKRVDCFRCGNCKTLFETEITDIPTMQYHNVNSDDPREHSYWSAVCPVCGTHVALLYPEKHVSR